MRNFNIKNIKFLVDFDDKASIEKLQWVRETSPARTAEQAETRRSIPLPASGHCSFLDNKTPFIL